MTPTRESDLHSVTTTIIRRLARAGEKGVAQSEITGAIDPGLRHLRNEALQALTTNGYARIEEIQRGRRIYPTCALASAPEWQHVFQALETVSASAEVRALLETLIAHGTVIELPHGRLRVAR